MSLVGEATIVHKGQGIMVVDIYTAALALESQLAIKCVSFS